ncbi:MAG: methyltransferase domain-containing protein [Micromonosporaceae bacterium]|nr:methyltransferase domain-containing protein [Micromonosporaceae bacterium]
MNTDAIIEHYTAEDEGARLTASPHGRLELARTKELLCRLLPPAPATVLDVGGATGVYAGWLASLGHRVHVVDLVPAHVEHAAALPGVTAALGDARALDAPDASVDAVLLFGPLYHLTERSARLRALREARRVARAAGVVAGAVISRYASLLDFTRCGDLDADRLARIMRTVETGRHDGRIGFMETHFHTGPEVAGEFADAGLSDPLVYGIEGPAWTAASAAARTLRADAIRAGELPAPLTDEHAQAVFDSALLAARAVERDPAMHPANAHLLIAAHATGHGPGRQRA